MNLADEGDADLRALERRLEDAAGVARWLAHDFGNVLTGILGFSGLCLAELPAGTPGREHLLEVLKAAHSGRTLIERLRAYSQRGAGTSARSDLAQAVTLEATRLRPLWGDGVELRNEVPAALPAAIMGTEAIGQLLAELLDNACRAAGPAGVVTVSARALELDKVACRQLLGNAAAGPMVETSVEDSGYGFEPEAWRRFLAEPFFSTRPQHHGLGMPVVYGLLHAHRGGFRIESAPGIGTVVRFCLPAAG